MDEHRTAVHSSYVAVKSACLDAKSTEAGDALKYLVLMCLRFLATECNRVDCISRVAGKTYFAFASKRAARPVSRPANAAYFVLDADYIDAQWDAWAAGKLSAAESQKIAYTVALAPCLTMEVFDRQNKKGPATYFECFIGHLFAKTLGINPGKRATIPVQGGNIALTMDFLFQLGDVGLHLPVKMSTRERIVQAWAHQRLLDAAFGDGAYKAVMVLFSETKLDSRSLEVVEICVPDQWLAYQSLLAKMDRIYYFDMPARYQALTDKYPDLIPIKPFGDFFAEYKTVLNLKQQRPVTPKSR